MSRTGFFSTVVDVPGATNKGITFRSHKNVLVVNTNINKATSIISHPFMKRMEVEIGRVALTENRGDTDLLKKAKKKHKEVAKKVDKMLVDAGQEELPSSKEYMTQLNASATTRISILKNSHVFGIKKSDDTQMDIPTGELVRTGLKTRGIMQGISSGRLISVKEAHPKDSPRNDSEIKVISRGPLYPRQMVVTTNQPVGVVGKSVVGRGSVKFSEFSQKLVKTTKQYEIITELSELSKAGDVLLEKNVNGRAAMAKMKIAVDKVEKDVKSGLSNLIALRIRISLDDKTTSTKSAEKYAKDFKAFAEDYGVEEEGEGEGEGEGEVEGKLWKELAMKWINLSGKLDNIDLETKLNAKKERDLKGEYYEESGRVEALQFVSSLFRDVTEDKRRKALIDTLATDGGGKFDISVFDDSDKRILLVAAATLHSMFFSFVEISDSSVKTLANYIYKMSIHIAVDASKIVRAAVMQIPVVGLVYAATNIMAGHAIDAALSVKKAAKKMVGTILVSESWQSVMRVVDDLWDSAQSVTYRSLRFSKEWLSRFTSFASNTAFAIRGIAHEKNIVKAYAGLYYSTYNYVAAAPWRTWILKSAAAYLTGERYQHVENDHREVIGSLGETSEKFSFIFEDVDLGKIESLLEKLDELSIKPAPRKGKGKMEFDIKRFGKWISTILSVNHILRVVNTSLGNTHTEAYMRKKLSILPQGTTMYNIISGIIESEDETRMSMARYYTLYVARNELTTAYNGLLEAFGYVLAYYAEKIAAIIGDRTASVVKYGYLWRAYSSKNDEYMKVKEEMEANISAFQLITRSLVYMTHDSCNVFAAAFSERIMKKWRKRMLAHLSPSRGKISAKQAITMQKFDRFVIATDKLSVLFGNAMHAISEPRKESVDVKRAEFPYELFVDDGNITIFERAKVILREIEDIDVSKFVVMDMSYWGEIASLVNQISYINYDASHRCSFGSTKVTEHVNSYTDIVNTQMRLSLVRSMFDQNGVWKIIRGVIGFDDMKDKIENSIAQIVGDDIKYKKGKQTSFIRSLSALSNGFSRMENLEQRMAKLHAVARATSLQGVASLSLFFNAFLFVARTKWFQKGSFFSDAMPRYRLNLPVLRMKDSLTMLDGAVNKGMEDMIVISAKRIYQSRGEQKDFTEELRAMVYQLISATQDDETGYVQDVSVVHICGIAYFILLHIRIQRSTLLTEFRIVSRMPPSEGDIATLASKPGPESILPYYSASGRLMRLANAEGPAYDTASKPYVQVLLERFVDMYINDIPIKTDAFNMAMDDAHVRLILHLYLYTKTRAVTNESNQHGIE